MTEEQKAEELDKWLELQKRWLHEKISLGKIYDVIEKVFYEGIDIGFKTCAKARLNVTTISDCPIKDEEESKYKTAYIKGVRTMANALKDYDRTDGAWTDYFEHTVDKVLKDLLSKEIE